MCRLKSLKPMARFELATDRLRIDCSTTELHRRGNILLYQYLVLMVKPTSKKRSNQRFTPEQYARLKTEAAAPYRGLRKFVYISFGASGFIGAFIFLTQLAAGRDVETALPNFALQVGVVALMIFLFRWDRERKQ